MGLCRLQLSTLNNSDTCTIIDSAERSASVFHYLSRTHKQNVRQFTHSAKNSIRGEAACFPTENMWLGLMERVEGGAEAADRFRFSLFRCDIKLSLSAHALLTFIGLLKKANAVRPSGK